MSLDWVAPTVAALGGVIAGAVAWARAKPEAKKMNADTTVALLTASGAFADDLYEQVKDLRDRLSEVERRERRRDRLLLAHREWDIRLVSQARLQGIDPGEPPPLWNEDDL